MFLFYAVHRRFAHIHTICARIHAHKQTPIHSCTTTHNCTNAPPHGMHSYLRALTLARTHTCTYSQPHTLTFLHFHTLTPSHSRALSLTRSQLSSLSHTVTLANLQVHSRAHSYTHIHSRACTRWHSFIHTILHTRALACTHSFVGYLTLPFSFSYVFVGCLTLLWVTLLCLLSYMYLRNAVDYLTLPIRCFKFSILWVTSLCLFALIMKLKANTVRVK